MPAPRLAEKLGKIESQAERLHRLIDELLDVSRIASGRLELEIEDVDLSQVASRWRAVSGRAARAGCALTVVAPTPVVGRWDHSRWSR